MPTIATAWTDVQTQMTSFMALDIVKTGLAVIIGVVVVGLIARGILGVYRSRR